MSTTFGFGGKKEGQGNETLAKLAKIKPQPETVAPVVADQIERVDRMAEQRGFVSREAKVRLPDRRKKIEGNTVGINMRAPEDVARDFIQFCDEHRLSYWEGIAELMRRDRAR